MTDFSSPSQPPAPRYGELDPSRQYQPTPYPPVQPSPPMEDESTKSGALGLVALIGAIVVFVVSAIVSVAVGMWGGTLIDPQMGMAATVAIRQNPDAVGFGLLVLGHVVLGTILGLWALVQGIFAVVLKRGRGYGVAAIVIAAAAPVVSYLIYSATLAAVWAGLG